MAEYSAHSASRGRPRFYVDREKVIFLRSLHFKWVDVAAILGVSEKTLQRRAKEWNISTYSLITDSELDVIVRRHLEEFPRSGEAMLRGHLLSLNIHVQRERLRRSVRRVSGNEHPRPTSTIYRRTYSVPGPNYLWHVDGHHKLIKWRLVTHGGIDGFSRLITYLQCSNNNQSETVTECFLKATQQYGVPSRVRSDHGSENVGIWRFMEEVRGENRYSYIAGRSVHNIRIERLWRDVYTSVISTYVQVFTDMEHEGILSQDNDTDIFCLHYIFLPRINASLCKFQEAWNNHPLSSEGNQTPLQLYAGGSIGNPLFEEHIDISTYGVDNLSVIGSSSDEVADEDAVVVPITDLGLSDADSLVLQRSINPMQECNDFGIQLYKNTAQVIYELMQQ